MTSDTSILDPGDLLTFTSEIRALLDDDRIPEALDRFSSLFPPDQADVMTLLSKEQQSKVLGELTHHAVGQVMQALDTETAVGLSEQLEEGQLSQVLDTTQPAVAADILRALPNDVVIQTLETMDGSDHVASLLEYESELSGALMTPRFAALREDMNVKQAMAVARRWSEDHDPEDVSHLFVVDKDDNLVGELPLGQLLTVQPESPISAIIRPVLLTVTPTADQEESARLMHRHGIQNMPVVDDGKLLGVLRMHDMVGVIEEEATEDMYRMMGVREEENVLGPIWHSIRSRLPWLFIYTATAFLSALAVGLFETTIAKVVALAVFLNLVPGHGGQGGVQTVTLVVRGMALGQLPNSLALRLLAKEVSIAIIHGLLLGAAVGVVAYVWKGNVTLGLVLGGAMVGNMVVGALAGAGVPLVLRWMKLDPAVSSAVFVTTFTDFLGVIFFLGLATLLVNMLQ